MRWVHCTVLKERAPGLDAPPLPGELGVRIYAHVSRRGWQMWLVRQQMLINERQLISAAPSTMEQLREPMERFLFHADRDGTLPPGFTPTG